MIQNTLDLSKSSKKERRLYFREIEKQSKKEEKKSSWTKFVVLGFSLLVLVFSFGYFWLTAAPSTPDSKANAGLTRTSGLELGNQAPGFSLPSANGQIVSSADYSGKNLLLYFQEGLMCQPCWKQIGTLEADLASFEKINTEIVTIGVDSASDWRPIMQSEGITKIPILVDSDRKMSTAYGVLSMSSQMHSDRPGHTFVLVNKEGKIAWIADYPTMRVSNGEILNSITVALKKQI